MSPGRSEYSSDTDLMSEASNSSDVSKILCLNFELYSLSSCKFSQIACMYNKRRASAHKWLLKNQQTLCVCSTVHVFIQQTDEDVYTPFCRKPFFTCKGHSADILDISWSKVSIVSSYICIGLKRKILYGIVSQAEYFAHNTRSIQNILIGQIYISELFHPDVIHG